MLWIVVVVAVLIFLDLLFVELRRAFREAQRIVRRIGGYGDLPLFADLAASGHDAERIARAIDTLPPLRARAQRAIATVRGYLPKGSSPG